MEPPLAPATGPQSYTGLDDEQIQQQVESHVFNLLAGSNPSFRFSGGGHIPLSLRDLSEDAPTADGLPHRRPFFRTPHTMSNPNDEGFAALSDVQLRSLSEAHVFTNLSVGSGDGKVRSRSSNANVRVTTPLTNGSFGTPTLGASVTTGPEVLRLAPHSPATREEDVKGALVRDAAAVQAVAGIPAAPTPATVVQRAPGGRLQRWMDRGGLLPHGSLMGSAFTLATATLGAGTIALPSAFLASGGVLGMLILLLCVACTIYSIRLLVIAKEMTGLQSYEQLSRYLVGPWFERLTAGGMITLCWGVTVVYVVAMSDILNPLRSAPGAPEVFQGPWGRRLVTTVFWALCMLPLSLPQQVNSLRYASLIGVGATFVLILAIIAFSATNGGTAANIPAARLNVGTLMAFPVFIFGTCCQTNVFEVYGELKNPTVNRMTAVAGITMALVTVVYASCGLAGVSAFGEATAGNILSNFTDPTGTWYIAAAFLGISFTLTAAFPMCIFPTRDALLQLVGYKGAADAPSFVRVPLAGGLATLSVLIGLFVPGITIMFGLLGGLLGSTMCYVWPAIFVLKTGHWTIRNAGLLNVVATWALVVFGTVVAIFSTVLSVLTISGS